MIKIEDINPSDIKLGVLGAGKSGLAVSRLAKHLGFNILLSDSNNIGKVDIDNIYIEEGGHSEKLLKSDFIIKSPGIPNHINIIKNAIKKAIQ